MPTAFLGTKHLRQLAVAGLFVVALFFATYQLTESPSFWYDEGWYFQSAANLSTQGVYGLQFSPGNIEHISMLQTVSYPLIFPLALWFKAFGVSVLSGRSFMAVSIMLLLATSYFLSKRLFGENAGLGTLALLVTFAPLYGNGKSILGEVPGLLYLMIFFVTLNMAAAGGPRKLWWLAAAGLAAGLAFTTKPFFFIIAPAILIGAYIGWRRRTFSPKEVGFIFVAFLVPVVIWYLVQFQSGESLRTIVGYYANPYAFESQSQLPSQASVIWQSFKGLFTKASTLYTTLILVIWSLAAGIRLKWRERLPLAEIIAWIFSILVFLAYLRVGGIFRYFFPAQIIALIFLPRSLSVVAAAIAGLWRSEIVLRRFRQILPVASVAVLGLFGVYQLTFDSWVAEAYGSHKTAFWQDYFAKVPASTQVFFYDTPEVAPFIRHGNYYQLLLSDRKNPLGKEGLPAIVSGQADKVVVETVKYEPAKDSLFKAYTVDEKAYKYSILKRK